MKTNTLGRTGLQISELVFGGGFVGGILLHASDDVRREVSRTIVANGWGLLELRPQQMSLEDVFLHLTTEDEAAGGSEAAEDATLDGPDEDAGETATEERTDG